MKYSLIAFFILDSVLLFSQERNFMNIPKEILNQFDKMGLDDTPLLDSCEAAYFNAVYEENLNGFNFIDKKIGFISAGKRQSKKVYFAEERKRLNTESTTISSILYVFDSSQKKESGGYDAAIVYWSKILYPVDKVISKLKD